ncbi:MAG: SIS domain-containing protein [Micrococcales bacterium]|nr:SIS domain-containing protein [Micrococcales bacterium]
MKATEYYQIISAQLAEQFEQSASQITEAATACAESIRSGRVIHVFGCGHSQAFAMEVFYRAGGLVPVNAILVPHLALFPRSKLSTFQERVEGFARQVLAMEATDPKDTMIVASISGRNAAPVDMALAAKEVGMTVVALVSRLFADSTTSRHSSGQNLKDVADIVIDIKCVAGDAVLSMEGVPEKFCGTSTVLGVAVMEAIIAETVEASVRAGYVPPTWVSSNLDRGDAINDRHISNYSAMISCL